MRIFAYVMTLLWITVGLYLGSAGWVGSKALQNTSVGKSAGESTEQFYYYDGLTFADEASLRDFLQERRSGRWFPWIFEVPQELTPLIASMAFGLLGGAIRLLKELILDKASVGTAQLICEPIFSSLIGVMLFFLSLLLPAVFTTGKNPVRPEALVGISLFGGIFSERAYSWVESQMTKWFSAKARRRTTVARDL